MSSQHTLKILVEAHHPADIHQFKNAIRLWQTHGHRVRMLSRDRDVMQALLGAYSWIDHRVLSRGHGNNRFPLREFASRQCRVATQIARFRPDVVLSTMGSYTQSARLLRVPSIIFTDSEHQTFNHRIAHPFAQQIYTPACFEADLGKKQRRYRGYHELAFLHPRYFSARPEVLSMLGNVEKHSYTIVRTSAFNTLHDIGQSGFGAQMEAVIDLAAAEGPVFIVAEGNTLPEKYKALHFSLPPDWFHDAMAYARLVVSEGASTASEAACLGIPAVYVNSHSLGYLRDQEKRYHLVDVLKPGAAIAAAVKKRLASTPDRARWDAAREALLADHDDVTEVIVDAALNVGRKLRSRTRI